MMYDRHIINQNSPDVDTVQITTYYTSLSSIERLGCSGQKFSCIEMGDSRYYSTLKILSYLLNQVFGGAEITVNVFNRDHYSEGMLVDGWIEIIFPKTIILNSRLKNTIRSMLDLIRESFANHPDFISTFGEANLGRDEGNFIICGLYDDSDSEPDLEIPYYKEWSTNDHNSTFTIKYSIAVKDKIVGEVNEALVKYDDTVDTATSLEMPRINRLKEDLAALHLTPSEVTEIIAFISTNPVYEFDLFSMGQDIYVSAYLAQHGEALGHVFDSTVILNIIKSEMNMSQ